MPARDIADPTHFGPTPGPLRLCLSSDDLQAVAGWVFGQSRQPGSQACDTRVRVYSCI